MFIVLPEYSEDMISEDLRHLTKILAQMDAEVSHGLLGGEYGYGAFYENDTFMMHPYCWCEKDDCPWCVSCFCPEEAYSYLVSGREVKFKDWLECPVEDRTTIIHQEFQCSYCRGEIEQAPNFLHKSSGTKVSWYKYIGRGMTIELGSDWRNVFKDCLYSLETN